jgi:hypothetical protein
MEIGQLNREFVLFCMTNFWTAAVNSMQQFQPISLQAWVEPLIFTEAYPRSTFDRLDPGMEHTVQKRKGSFRDQHDPPVR